MPQDRNWAGNFRYGASRFVQPESVEQLQEAVQAAGRMKAIGTGHSFNSIADTDETHVSTAKLDRILGLDLSEGTVNIEGGVRYGELCRYLDREGFGLANLASLPHISVAGACATATHGSGLGNGNLATSVVAIEIVDARGELRRFSRQEQPEAFSGMVVHLGALGVVARLELKVEPARSFAQLVFERMPLLKLEANLEEVMRFGYSVSLFTDWASGVADQAWVKYRADHPIPSDMFFGAQGARRPLHPIRGVDPVNCTAQLGAPGPWYDRLPHFRLDFTPSSGEELQSEFFVPFHKGFDAIRLLCEMGSRIAPLLHVSEIRAVAKDDLWMSPCFGQDCLALHFTWKPHEAEVRALLPDLEKRLAPLGARPHWGKIFTVEPRAVGERLPRFADFRELTHSLDPDRKFRNGFLNALLDP